MNSNLQTKIRELCVAQPTDFTLLKNPVSLNSDYGSTQSPSSLKGTLFEFFLAELFRGNGYTVTPLGEGGKDGGCDLLVKYPDDNSIRFVVQAKNWSKSIDEYTIRTEFLKFQDNYKKTYDLDNSQFCFIAWKYVKNVRHKVNSKIRINVWDEQDIRDKLLKTFSKDNVRKPKIILTNYQEEAYKKIIYYWQKNERCYVEHATGTGKTYLIAKLVEQLHLAKNRILILSPSKYINSRIIELLTPMIPNNEIAKRFKNAASLSILTYQYLFHNSSKIPTGHFTHIIMDEAHRAGAYQWYNKGLLRIISDETKIVGLSATMQRYSSGIDIKKFLGNNCAGKLSVFDAMARDILPTGDYVFSVIDIKSKIDELKQEVNNKYRKQSDKLNSIYNALDSKQIKNYSIQRIIHKHYGQRKYQKIIAFCEDFEHAIDTVALLEKVFIKFSIVKINKITSKGSKRDNQNLLRKFSEIEPDKNDIFIIVAIDMLNEGIDVRGIDSVMLFRKTESPRIYFQQIGRTLRKQGKTSPLIFDCTNNFQNINVNFFEEVEREINDYREILDDFGLEEIETPKPFSINDETVDISNIIQEVETKLNFYQSYEEAKQATHELGIKSEAEYRKKYLNDLRLPSKPHYIYNNRGWTNWYNFLGTEKPNFYSTYLEAKLATKRLNIKSVQEYKIRYKEDSRLPSQPDRTYRSDGWTNWSDYFGIKTVQKYQLYQEAKKAARKLGIKSHKDYKIDHYKDPRLPYNPNLTYKNRGWVNYPEFLGESSKDIYPTYTEAKRAVKKLNIKSEKEYRIRRHEDERLPASPDRFYNDKGWINFFDFFSKNKPSVYTTYNEAKNAVRKLKINSRREYFLRYKDDPNLPSNPEDIYSEKGWTNFNDFLGTEKPVNYKTYEEAKQAVRKLGIKTRREYIEEKRYKEDPMLPSNPSSCYKKKGWTNWNDFIVTNYATYEDAKEAARKVGIKTRTEYIKHKRYKEDPLLPSDPEKRYYKKGWINWFHFLGTKQPIQHYSYDEAKRIIRKLGIKTLIEYKRRRSKDQKFPSNPSEFYKNKGWISTSDFLNVNKPNYYKTYNEAKRAVKELGITTINEYRDIYKKDPRLPITPNVLYKSRGWKDWATFLGKKPVNIYPTFEEAKQAVKQLGIKNRTEYRKQKVYKEDPRLPSSPDKKYKNTGWINWKDFLR